MPVLEDSHIAPILPLRNGHFNTVYANVFRSKKALNYSRERWTTPDDDFIDLDWIQDGNQHLIILLHGLEGSTHSRYILHMADYARSQGFDVCAVNFRGCSGEPNLKYPSYHSGQTYDLRMLVRELIYNRGFQSIFVLGYSLGGNVTLKHLGEEGTEVPKALKAACALSVPIHLESCNDVLKQGIRKLYVYNFLRTLIPKTIHKMKKHGVEADRISAIRRCRSLRAYDDLYTAPAHGFDDALDYWNKASSIHYLDQIACPTLLINAADDPFLSEFCYPIAEAHDSEFLHLHIPRYGGHVGFVERLKKNEALWYEKEVLQFFKLFQ